MATKKKPETPREMKARHIETLEAAYQKARRHFPLIWAQESYAELRAVVYAITPGRQKAKNIGSQLDKAVAAAARVIRRRP